MAVLAPAMALGATVGLASAPASAAAVWNSCDQWGSTSLDGYKLFNNIWGSTSVRSAPSVVAHSTEVASTSSPALSCPAARM